MKQGWFSMNEPYFIENQPYFIENEPYFIENEPCFIENNCLFIGLIIVALFMWLCIYIFIHLLYFFIIWQKKIPGAGNGDRMVKMPAGEREEGVKRELKEEGVF